MERKLIFVVGKGDEVLSLCKMNSLDHRSCQNTQCRIIHPGCNYYEKTQQFYANQTCEYECKYVNTVLSSFPFESQHSHTIFLLSWSLQYK